MVKGGGGSRFTLGEKAVLQLAVLPYIFFVIFERLNDFVTGKETALYNDFVTFAIICHETCFT